MAVVQMRYVTARRNKNGGVRWYWVRPGFPSARLPDDEKARFTRQQELNQAADNARLPETPHEGSFNWLLDIYIEHKAYRKLSPNTKYIYGRWIKHIRSTLGHLSVAGFHRTAAFALIDKIDGVGNKIHCQAVLSKILGIARNRGVVSVNVADKMELETYDKRDAMWEDPQIAAFIKACQEHPHGAPIALGFWLLLYQAQRLTDTLNMTWSQYNGETITLRQQKTGKLIEVACHRDLKAVLEKAKETRKSLVIIGKADGTAYSRALWGHYFRQIRNGLKLDDLQARDLRRTAMVRMAEAGCTDFEISAVSGHTIDETRRILETYVPRTFKMSKAAMARWEQSANVLTR